MSSGVHVFGHDSCTSKSDRIRSIKEELRKLEEEHEQAIRKFHQNRTSLLRILNDEQALTRNLPPETMSLIFQHTYNGTYARGSMMETDLALGRVSSQWRQIAWSTPQLWMELDIAVESHTMRKFLYLLQLHLHNVRNLPISLHFEFFEYDSEEDDMEFFPEETITVLSELLKNRDNAAKIRSLSVHHAPQQLILDLSQGAFSQGNFSRLEDLDLFSNDSDLVSGFILKDLPCLRKLELQSIAPAPVELSWSIITFMCLTDIPIDICMKLFVQCTSLIEVHILAPTTSTDGLPWETSIDTTTFPYLETLTWTSEPDSNHLLRRVHVPLLRTLKLHGHYSHEEGLQDALADNLPAPPTLTVLELNHLRFLSLPFFERLFSRTEHLQVLDLSTNDRQSITNALSVLMPGSGTEEQVSYLPSLTQLKIWANYEIPLGDEWVWRIFKFLERQWRSGLGGFNLSLPRNWVDWDLDVKQAIFGLIRQGFHLEIYERDTLVDWLCPDNQGVPLDEH